MAIPTELFIPVRILILRAKDGRRFLSPPMQELEDIPLWASGEAIHPGLAPGGLGHRLFVSSVRTRHFQGNE